MTETYRPWRSIPDVLTPCAGVVLHADPADLTVRLGFSDVRGAPGQDMLVRYGERAVARHFRFTSLDNTVDVLTLGDATAEWTPAAARGP